MNKQIHVPVLLQESINYLITDKNGIYIDGTLGLGGHSEEILKKLSKKGQLIGIDQDKKNLEFAKDRLKKYKNFTAIHANFAELKALLQKRKIKEINGLLLDLGLSSPHVDNADRGFSFLQTGPLDMRFDVNSETTAADLLNTLDRQEITDILRNYGEEQKAWKIAGLIIEERRIKTFKDTDDLKNIIAKAYGREKIKGKSVATQSFQALRIAVNNEIEVLEKILDDLPEILAPKARFVCISYHSLEDRIVKHKLKNYSKDIYSDDWRPQLQKKATFKILTKKPFLPSEDEIKENPRSRSAKMRIAEKF